MTKTMRVVITVLGGIAAGWAGYWLGHLLGWSEGADWPTSIGGGWAVLVSLTCAVTGAMWFQRLLGLTSRSRESTPPPSRSMH